MMDFAVKHTEKCIVWLNLVENDHLTFDDINQSMLIIIM